MEVAGLMTVFNLFIYIKKMPSYLPFQGKAYSVLTTNISFRYFELTTRYLFQVHLYRAENKTPFSKNMWRNLQKGTLLRNKYHRPWSDAAHYARRLISSYDMCRSWASKENMFVVPCAVVIKNTFAKEWNIWSWMTLFVPQQGPFSLMSGIVGFTVMFTPYFL